MIIMPVMAGPEMTEQAIDDCLAQSVDVRVLVINQGADDILRARLERIAEAYPEQVFLWSHDPPLPSLSATWNRALDFVWENGGQEALVVNNDVRLHRATVEILRRTLLKTGALFVTAVGVTKEQFDPESGYTSEPSDTFLERRGGPDFSCFLISKECHAKYRFDENFTPAYCEDLDYHRRLMLGGDGHRIFSVNLPYWHLAAQTLKQVDPQKKMRIERQIESGSRAYYVKKWGGPVNHETFYEPFNAPFETTRDTPTWEHRCGPTTPELQAWCQTSMHDADRSDEILKEANTLHGLPEPIGTEDFPLTHRVGEYMGQPRK